MKETKKLVSAKIFALTSIFVFTFVFTPFYSFADGENVTSTVEAFAKNPEGNVTKNVGNVDITSAYDARAMGIYSMAQNGKKAVINANNINVNVSGVSWLYGVYATAGTKGIMGSGASSGRINITTQNIKSKDQGLDVRSLIEGSELSITTNGNIQGGVGATPNGGLYGYGMVASANNGAKTTAVVNGNVSGLDVGISVIANDESTKGNVNVNVYGDVVASNETNGRGLVFNWTSDTADVLVTGTIAGAKYGVNTKINNQDFYHPEFGVNNLTVWKISAPNNNLVVKQTGDNDFETDNEYASKINYIIKHDDNVAPKKANGSNLDVSHGYPVAKEGDKVIIDTALDGVYLKKVFNAGAQVTQTDENGNYYVVVQRGGGVDLTAEIEVIEKTPNPITLKGKVVKVKALALSKKAQTRKIVKAIKITNAKGTLSYQKVKGKKKITIDPNTGKITIKKGLKKGKYKVTVNVTASGDETYKPLTSKVVFTINVI